MPPRLAGGKTGTIPALHPRTWGAEKGGGGEEEDEEPSERKSRWHMIARNCPWNRGVRVTGVSELRGSVVVARGGRWAAGRGGKEGGIRTEASHISLGVRGAGGDARWVRRGGCSGGTRPKMGWYGGVGDTTVHVSKASTHRGRLLTVDSVGRPLPLEVKAEAHRDRLKETVQRPHRVPVPRCPTAAAGSSSHDAATNWRRWVGPWRSAELQHNETGGCRLDERRKYSVV